MAAGAEEGWGEGFRASLRASMRGRFLPPPSLKAGRLQAQARPTGPKPARRPPRCATPRPAPCQVPRFALPPPWREGAWKLQDGLDVGRSLHETLTDMLTVINKAVDTLPDLTRPA